MIRSIIISLQPQARQSQNANSNGRNSQQLVAAPTAGTVGDERAKSALLLRLEVDLATAVAIYAAKYNNSVLPAMLQMFQPAQTRLERMHKNGDIDGLFDLYENKIRHVHQMGTLQAGIPLPRPHADSSPSPSC